MKLEDLNVSQIRKLVSTVNKKVKITGYSKMKKEPLIGFLRTHPELIVNEGGQKITIKTKMTDTDVGSNVKHKFKYKKSTDKKSTVKKPRSEKQKANDKRLGEMAKKRAKKTK